jgi:hypothetical protein
MTDIFTVEEINLICIFNTASRVTLIQDLIDAIDTFDTGDPLSDDEMFEIAQNALNKLSKMNDSDFAALDFYPIYDDDEQEVDT